MYPGFAIRPSPSSSITGCKGGTENPGKPGQNKSRLFCLVPFSHQGPQQACARGTFGSHAPLLAPPHGSPSKIAIVKDWDPPPRRRPQWPRTKPSSATPRTARPAPWPRVGNPLYPSVYCSDAPRRLPALVGPRRAHFNRSWSPSSVGAHVHHRRPESSTIMRHGHLRAVPTNAHLWRA